MVSGDQGWTVPVLHEAAFTNGLHRHRQGFGGPWTSIGVRTARYALLRHRTGEDELYDLWRDPAENDNVYGVRRYRQVRRELLRVWRTLHSCQGVKCQTPLPAVLAASPAEERRLTTGYWRDLTRIYGFAGSGPLHP
jgi:hypothetical protein